MPTRSSASGAGRRSGSPRRSRAASGCSTSSPGRPAIDAEDAFTLAATYGFPIELTQELAEERGQPVDIDGFRELMEEHRVVSRAGGDKSDLQRAAEFAQAAGFESEFVGYAKLDVLTQAGAVEDLGDGTFLCKLRESPFYAESGGQVTDSGELVHEESGAVAVLRAAYKIGDDQALALRGQRLRRPAIACVPS